MNYNIVVVQKQDRYGVNSIEVAHKVSKNHVMLYVA